ncbi:MAG: 4-(cytidine 5'-diphospho)-2-C-methyl-D-erythritol kinase, partial [Solobacterium sp.]|nr:4-(cytidine 5'-diphospho)-2-C-methyl-D-erythritol kinase [Solobacterium sp.]
PAAETGVYTDKRYIPGDDRNTVVKAIHVLQQRYGFTQNFACRLKKHIPTRAGLAGGSADAAAAIRIINIMMQLNMSREELIEVGKEVGADVPFCIFNKPSYVEGIGEKLEPFVCHPSFNILLVKPSKGVSTGEAFALMDDEMDYVHPDPLAMRDALIRNDYDGVIANLGNSMEGAAVRLVKQVATVKEKLMQAGFDGVLMSGSGSTVFGITRDMTLLNGAMRKLKSEGYFVRHTQILS